MEALGAGADLSPVRVNFSTALSIGTALVAGRLTHEELDPAWLRAHEDEIRALAARTTLRHDWELTVRTVRAPIDAGLGLGDVPLSAWPRVRRRMKDLHMDDLQPRLRDLRQLVPRLIRGWRGVLGSRENVEREPGAATGPAGDAVGLARLDTAAPLMTFPCNVTIRLRSGRLIELEGKETGGGGHPLDEQRAVVAEKARATGVEEPAWTAA
jgi:hypothetical protein